jgi:predicted glycoside hydrolase/deacetylase ChbG (UPF0249 family)
MLIINADDLGRTSETTDNIISCFRRGRITSASAMVFMSDSERAAAAAAVAGLESGLHLNLDLPFDGPGVPPRLQERHGCVVAYLRGGRWKQLTYNPLLKNAFRYVYQAQYDEYGRLFGREPAKIDGHDHMHLCMNMLADRIIPLGKRVRRNLTFGAPFRATSSSWSIQALGRNATISSVPPTKPSSKGSPWGPTAGCRRLRTDIFGWAWGRLTSV